MDYPDSFAALFFNVYAAKGAESEAGTAESEWHAGKACLREANCRAWPTVSAIGSFPIKLGPFEFKIIKILIIKLRNSM